MPRAPRRDHLIVFRTRPAEHAVLWAAAESLGTTLSEFAREHLLGVASAVLAHEPPPVSVMAVGQTVCELGVDPLRRGVSSELVRPRVDER